MNLTKPEPSLRLPSECSVSETTATTASISESQSSHRSDTGGGRRRSSSNVAGRRSKKKSSRSHNHRKSHSPSAHRRSRRDAKAEDVKMMRPVSSMGDLKDKGATIAASSIKKKPSKKKISRRTTTGEVEEPIKSMDGSEVDPSLLRRAKSANDAPDDAPAAEDIRSSTLDPSERKAATSKRKVASKKPRSRSKHADDLSPPRRKSGSQLDESTSSMNDASSSKDARRGVRKTKSTSHVGKDGDAGEGTKPSSKRKSSRKKSKSGGPKSDTELDDSASSRKDTPCDEKEKDAAGGGEAAENAPSSPSHRRSKTTGKKKVTRKKSRCGSNHGDDLSPPRRRSGNKPNESNSSSKDATGEDALSDGVRRVTSASNLEEDGTAADAGEGLEIAARRSTHSNTKSINSAATKSTSKKRATKKKSRSGSKHLGDLSPPRRKSDEDPDDHSVCTWTREKGKKSSADLSPPRRKSGQDLDDSTSSKDKVKRSSKSHKRSSNAKDSPKRKTSSKVPMPEVLQQMEDSLVMEDLAVSFHDATQVATSSTREPTSRKNNINLSQSCTTGRTRTSKPSKKARSSMAAAVPNESEEGLPDTGVPRFERKLMKSQAIRHLKTHFAENPTVHELEEYTREWYSMESLAQLIEHEVQIVQRVRNLNGVETHKSLHCCWRGLEHIQQKYDKGQHIMEHVKYMRTMQRAVSVQQKEAEAEGKEYDPEEELRRYSCLKTKEDRKKAYKMGREDAKFVKQQAYLASKTNSNLDDELPPELLHMSVTGMASSLVHALNPLPTTTHAMTTTVMPMIAEKTPRRVSCAVAGAKRTASRTASIAVSGASMAMAVSGASSAMSGATTAASKTASIAVSGASSAMSGATTAASKTASIAVSGASSAMSGATSVVTGATSVVSGATSATSHLLSSAFGGATSTTSKLVSAAVVAPIRGATHTIQSSTNAVVSSIAGHGGRTNKSSSAV